MNHKVDKQTKGLAKSVRRQTNNPFLLPVLVAVLGLVLAGQVSAQTFKVLHNFTALDPGALTNSDGANPASGLILSAGTTLYGTSWSGGSGDSGTVFALSTDGTALTTLHSFDPTTMDGVNNDGAGPAGLLLSGNTLYGTANYGGFSPPLSFISGAGTVFSLNTDGTGFTVLYTFPTTLEGEPNGPLVLSGNTLYGTTLHGGSSYSGAVFALSTDGTTFTVLHSFTASAKDYDTNSPAYNSYTNSDGANPYAGLILSGNTLYGTSSAGTGGAGTVFKLNTDGTGYTILYSFTASAINSAGFYTNSDGASPGGLTLSGNTLYGTTGYGDPWGNGTVFKLSTDGTGFSLLHAFTAETASDLLGHVFNSDGAGPNGGLVLSGTTLYGTAYDGGSGASGTVFALNTNGTGFSILHTFTAMSTNSLGDYTNSDGALPQAGLLLLGNTLYGTTGYGGTEGNGTLFSISFAPQLTITPSGTNVILSWPTNYAGFDYTGYQLETTTVLGSSAIWTTNLPAPLVVNGQFTVTNPISGTQQFFRLSQ